VSRYVGAFSSGRIVNTKMARSQLLGSMIWGIGMALQEHTIHDARLGVIVNDDLAEYLVPVNADVPGQFEAILVEEPDSHVNPLGVKGLGEIGNCGASAAIANAVFHATGTRVRDLPITLDKVLGA
jgi:xanthine dehydrogenase YagR molybdenum-binding subunit